MIVNNYEIKNGANLRYANLQDADLRSANLQGADLRDANLRGADLQYANLQGADLQYANLQDADLRSADLRYANLRCANLWCANLRYANLRCANLRYANLQDADLQYANLQGADLRDANLRGADLQYADLQGANLQYADLSGCKGLLNAAYWLKKNFKFDTKGNLIVYKAFGKTNYEPPARWKIKPNAVITEIANPCRTINCGCGINFATLAWIKKNYDKVDIEIRQCYIKPIDLIGVVVPYNTDGKARCERLIIGKKIKIL